MFFLPLQSEIISRKIVAFWDSKTEKIIDDSLVHKTLEMPLNFIGLDAVYHDIQEPLPKLSKDDGVRGILISFPDTTSMPDPQAFIEWAIAASDMGKKIVIMNGLGFQLNNQQEFTSVDLQNKLFQKIGLFNDQEWIEYTYDVQIINRDKTFPVFEIPYPNPLPGYNHTKAFGSGAKAYLTVGVPGKPETYADVIIISPGGAYVANFYNNNYDPIMFSASPRSLGWYFDPVKFFEIAFDAQELPKPDVTTLAGKRVYIAACHGDSWITETQIEKYRKSAVISSQIILDQVIKVNPDLPMTVAVVAADVDPNWVGNESARETARQTFLAKNVQAASHTYSHPFFWDFFRTGGPEKEIDYLHLYPYGSWQNSFVSWFRAKMYQIFSPEEFAKRLKWGYTTPRSYANEPFNLEKEIGGAIDYLQQFAPPENQVKMLVWSGDSRPWDTPHELCKKANVRQFGGGYVRFDREHPSYLFIYPTARRPGGYIQALNAANGDNDYTNEWKDQFYAYQFLAETLKNTGAPRRLKPILIYFHSYSGEFEASVEAVLKNIAYSRTEPIIPLTVARYCDMVDGYFSTHIEKIGSDKWKVRDRKGLQTIRFDYPDNVNVDYSQSSGVIGSMKLQGSLYVYLDSSMNEAIISLSKTALSDTPYLEESTWEIWNVQRNGKAIEFDAQGWGNLSMRWKVPKGKYKVSSTPESKEAPKIQQDADTLNIEMSLPYDQIVHIKIEMEI